ncbi:scavenger receptor cysteine-rich domain-containing protein DMBT1-like [Diadema setosum]|uniref:scavenger receptor cysteine-rich domain-containing protein DMBT1-like n=1 Tax=Diadema setosum TaxID=31175 RepID=UPI003B3A213B
MTLTHSWLQDLDKRRPPSIDAIFFDFAKAFDCMPQDVLLQKLSLYNISGDIWFWIRSFLSGRLQRARYKGHYSEWSTPTSGLPQGSVLGPCLFNLFINDLPEAVASRCALFADDTVISRPIYALTDQQALQDDVNALAALPSPSPSSAPFQLRLVGGSNNREGRVEVYYDGAWGTICDDEWDSNDAEVVCRMLGYPAAERAIRWPGFGPGEGRILLDNVQCQGSEERLLDCPHNGFLKHNCRHQEDAGVSCRGKAPSRAPFQLRLVGGSNNREGRVEVYYDGAWGTICDDEWDSNDAEVVCRMLGYPAAERAIRWPGFGPGEGRILLDNVQCQGSEERLLDCPHNGFLKHNCRHQEDAGVSCRASPSPSPSRAPFQLRLVGGSNNREGRVEVYYDGAWGTICDDEWDSNDAEVVCRMLGYPAAERAIRWPGFGPVPGK